MPPGRLRSPPAAPGPRSRASVPDALPAAARRAGRRSWRRTRSGPCPRRRRPAAGRRPDPCRARWRHSSPRPPPPQRAEGLRLGLQQFPPAWSTLRSASWRYPVRLHRIALALLERGVDPADRFLTPLLEPEDLYAQLARQKLHRLVTQKPQNDLTLARHVHRWPSPSGLPAKPGLGKRGRAKLARIYHRPINSNFLLQNYRSCSGPPWTLRLSQFCVQGNRGPTQSWFGRVEMERIARSEFKANQAISLARRHIEHGWSQDALDMLNIVRDECPDESPRGSWSVKPACGIQHPTLALAAVQRSCVLQPASIDCYELLHEIMRRHGTRRPPCARCVGAR